jgi:hypothetical protein
MKVDYEAKCNVTTRPGILIPFSFSRDRSFSPALNNYFDKFDDQAG